LKKKLIGLGIFLVAMLLWADTAEGFHIIHRIFHHGHHHQGGVAGTQGFQLPSIGFNLPGGFQIVIDPREDNTKKDDRKSTPPAQADVPKDVQDTLSRNDTNLAKNISNLNALINGDPLLKEKVKPIEGKKINPIDGTKENINLPNLPPKKGG
jgi:hypothetical protein